MNILADRTLPHLTSLFGQSFNLSYYDELTQVPQLLKNQDVLLCRSTLKVTPELLQGSQIKYVATASSGTDHINGDYLKQQGIILLDAKGSNARAVADYVVSTIAWLSQHQKVIKHKAGIIGLGAVGQRVYARLSAAGYDIVCFDPIKAISDKQFESCTFQELTTCDLLCIHANYHDTTPYPSKQLINLDFMNQLQPNTIIINAARGDIVHEDALLKLDKPLIYCTDVYSNEPAINPLIIDYATLCTPHIAGHSVEAKLAAVVQLSQQLHHYFNLPMPALPTTSVVEKSRPLLKPTWQDLALSFFNPEPDTILLKKAHNKQQAFLSQRKAHLNRHDFNVYQLNHLDQQTQLLFGA